GGGTNGRERFTPAVPTPPGPVRPRSGTPLRTVPSGQQGLDLSPQLLPRLPLRPAQSGQRRRLADAGQGGVVQPAFHPGQDLGAVCGRAGGELAGPPGQVALGPGEGQGPEPQLPPVVQGPRVLAQPAASLGGDTGRVVLLACPQVVRRARVGRQGSGVELSRSAVEAPELAQGGEGQPILVALREQL